MKRFVIAIVLLTCVAFGNLFITYVSENAIKETRDAILLCAEKEKDISLDVIKIKTALNTWEKNRKIMYMFMFHDDFSEIEKNMVKLRYLSEYPDFLEIKRISLENSMMLDDKSNHFRVNFENIF
ncbi:MAG: hypothetical protein IKL09_08745 [Clostridia bacterium]|nr:hypothetical protein [Clostridia bacterium]